MAKLFFYYGAMGASKTANALMTAYNYREKNQDCVIFKPIIDTRDSNHKLTDKCAIIKSRSGIQDKAELISESTDIYNNIENKLLVGSVINCIIVDEVQFLTKSQIEQLSDIVDNLEIPVMCYGLRTNFKGELFEGSKWLLACADVIEEIKTICWCGKKATYNARLFNGNIIKHGEVIDIGGNDKYTSLCRKHWKLEKLNY